MFEQTDVDTNYCILLKYQGFSFGMVKECEYSDPNALCSWSECQKHNVLLGKEHTITDEKWLFVSLRIFVF